MSAGLQILVRDQARQFVGELEYERAELVPRFLSVGSWTLDIGFDGNLNSSAGRLLQPGAGIAAVVGGGIVFSGPVTKPARIRDGDNQQLTVAGVDDLVLIEDRVAHQDPSIADTPEGDNTYTQAEDVRAANAETVIKQFVNVNAGPGAIPDRRQTGLTIATDGQRGLAIQESGRMQNLLELMIKDAKAGGLGLSCIQTGPGTVVFDVYIPADKTDDVVFGINVGNLNGYEYSAERPTGNHYYAAGAGVSLNRVFKVAGDSISADDWGRIESFINEGNTSSMSKLLQTINTELLATAGRYFFSAAAIDTGQHVWAPLAPFLNTQVETYDLGDRVRVLADGQEITEVIHELHVVHDKDGLRVTPVIGSADQGGSPERKFFSALIRELRSMRLQIRDLQRG